MFECSARECYKSSRSGNDLVTPRSPGNIWTEMKWLIYRMMAKESRCVRAMNFDHRCRTVITVGCIALFQTIAFAENPFLFAKDDQPKVTRFRGTEWGDDISDDDDEDDLPL